MSKYTSALDLKIKWNRTRTSIEKFENNTLATKVFLHDWAAKKLYFDAVHDRVISIKDVKDIQVTCCAVVLKYLI